MPFACNARMKHHAIVSAACLAVLAGCATNKPSPHSAPSAPSPSSAAPSPSPAPVPTVSLPAEQRRLSDLFRGTPVVFEMQADGSMRVAVPLKYSFDKGRAAVKPPLAKVLDYLAPSLRYQSMRAKVAAPPDAPKAAASLAQERAASTRDYLIAKGIPLTHFAALTPAQGDGVEIVIGDANVIR